MERVGRNIFRGGGAQIFKTCVSKGWCSAKMIGSQSGGEGGGGHLKCSLI